MNLSYFAGSNFKLLYMSETLEERFEKLSYIYALPCPKCGSQWSFELTPNGWKEVSNCDCDEYHELIDQRWNQVYRQPKHDR